MHCFPGQGCLLLQEPLESPNSLRRNSFRCLLRRAKIQGCSCEDKMFIIAFSEGSRRDFKVRLIKSYAWRGALAKKKSGLACASPDL